MALTQAQKNILDKMTISPNEILEDIKNNKINLNEFIDEYFQNGRGFTHFLLDSYTYQPEKFEPLIKYVIYNSNLSFEDFKRHKESAFQDLINSDNSDKKLHSLIFIINHLGEKLKDNNFSTGMGILYQNGFKKDFNYFLNKRNQIKFDFYWENIIEKIIIDDDLITLKNLINKFDRFEPEYIRAKTLTTQTYNRKEASNLLTLAVIYSTEISQFFIDQYNYDLSGKVKNHYNSFNYSSSLNKTVQESISPLAQSYYSNNLELFNKLWLKDLSHLTYPIFLKRKVGEGNLLEMILNEGGEFYQLTKDNILKIDTFDNNKILNNILTSSINIQDKLQLTKHIVPRITGENLEKNILLNCFFSNIYNNNNKTQKPIQDIEVIGNIFSIIYNDKKISKEYVDLDIFKINLINNHHLFQNLIANGLKLSTINGRFLSNPFHLYFENTEKLNNTDLLLFYDKINTIESQKVFNTIKTVYQKEIFTDECKANILEMAISRLDINFLNNLTDKELLILKQKNNILENMKRPNEPLVKLYTEVCDFLYQKDIYFFKRERKFYEIFSYVKDYYLIDKILKKEKTSIFELSQNDNFWNYINYPGIADYVKSRGADYSSIDITRELLSANKDAFNLYIQNGGNTTLRENSNNLLHLLIKNGEYSKANCVLKHHNELAQEMNEQLKIPLSYFLKDFNKLCKENKERDKANYSHHFKEALELFNNYMEYGGFNKNEKSKKIILEQLVKYTEIKHIIPDLDTIVLYKSIDSDMEKKNTITKRVKI